MDGFSSNFDEKKALITSPRPMSNLTFLGNLSYVCENENEILVEYETKIIFYSTILNDNNRKAFSL